MSKDSWLHRPPTACLWDRNLLQLRKSLADFHVPLRWEHRFDNLDKHQIESTVVKDIASPFDPVANITCVQGMAFHCFFSCSIDFWIPFWILERFVWSGSRLSSIGQWTTIVVIRDVHCGQLFSWFCNTYAALMSPYAVPYKNAIMDLL